jgi:hypothetical protein
MGTRQKKENIFTDRLDPAMPKTLGASRTEHHLVPQTPRVLSSFHVRQNFFLAQQRIERIEVSGKSTDWCIPAGFRSPERFRPRIPG